MDTSQGFTVLNWGGSIVGYYGPAAYATAEAHAREIHGVIVSEATDRVIFDSED